MARRELSYYDTERRRRKSSSRRNRGYRREERRSSRSDDRRGRRFSLFDRIMLFVSVVIALGVALSWAARWINPVTYGFLSAAGLVMPVLFVANFLCLLYWVIRWRRGIFIPLAVFLIGMWGMTMFFRPELTHKHGDTSRRDRSLVSIATYNVRGMLRLVESHPGRMRSSMSEVVSIVDSLRPDILCMQEFASTAEHPRSRFEESLPVYHYKRVRLGVTTGGGHGWGNAIYSKFPITGSGHIDFEGTNSSVLWADIAIAAGRDTVRVFNVHLQTTSVKADDERYIVEGDFVGDSTLTRHMKRIAGGLKRNYVIRAGQAEIVADSIAVSPYPVVVCGDFNDTPISYAFRTVSHGLRDSFREAGRGYGYSYRGFYNLLRIDYVLHSRNMECVEYTSPSFSNSDHNPVAVKLKRL